MDGLIVVLGFVLLFPAIPSSTATASAVRTFRVMRPLKNLCAMPAMRLVVKSVLTALPSLGNVTLLLAFALTLELHCGPHPLAGRAAGPVHLPAPRDGGARLYGTTRLPLTSPQLNYH
jgi:hypothetical protein